MRNKRGITLIEILIVTAIAVIIFGFGYFISVNFYKNYALRSEKETLTSVLKKARSQALNNVNASARGVYIGDDFYTLFSGNSFASRNSQYDENIAKSKFIDSSGLNEILFAPLSATSTASGTIVLTNGLKSMSISVNYEGRIASE